jgi:hypothetical protein
MKSPFYFIVKPLEGKRYNNTKNIRGVELIISTSIEDHRYSNREAEVIELPLGYEGDIQKGDILLVHHNVFKFYNDMYGNQRSGKSFLKDDIFFVDNDQFFLYKHNGKWKAHDRYCFVKPIPPDQSHIYKPLSEEPLMGIMKYPNKRLNELGVFEGDKVCFTPDSEYEFNVDGEKLFRIFEHQITIKL